MRILQDFVSLVLMRFIGSWVRLLVRLVFSLLLVGGLGGYGLYKAGCYQLKDQASVVCQAGGDVLDALRQVHASSWRQVVRDPCLRGDLAVAGCWANQPP